MASALLRSGMWSDCSAVHKLIAAWEFVFCVYHISESVLCRTAEAQNVELRIGRSLESENGL